MFLAVPLAMSLLALILSRGRLTPITLLVLLQAQVLAGTFLLDEQFGLGIAPLHTMALLAAIGGYYAIAARTTRAQATLTEPPPVVDLWRARFVSGVIVVLVAYHFVVGGIPALSNEVETARFAFSASGLLGIPGRMFLFGLPFAALMSLLAAIRQPSVSTRRLAQVVWSAFVLSQLLGGFKGGIVTVILVALLGLALAGRAIDISAAIRSRWLLGAGAAAVLVAVFYSFQYRSVGVDSPDAAVKYLAARLTVVGAQPGYVALTQLPSPADPPYIADDISYFAERYLGLRIAASPRFPLDQKVSALMSGRQLSRDEFLVPVTVGAFPGWAVDIGRPLAVGAMVLLGIAFAVLVRAAERSRALFSAALFSLGVYMMLIYLQNGGFVYVLANGVAVAAFLAILWLIAGLLVSLGKWNAARHAIPGAVRK